MSETNEFEDEFGDFEQADDKNEKNDAQGNNAAKNNSNQENIIIDKIDHECQLVENGFFFLIHYICQNKKRKYSNYKGCKRRF